MDLLLYTDILVYIVGSRQYLEKPYKHSAYISTYIHSQTRYFVHQNHTDEFVPHPYTFAHLTCIINFFITVTAVDVNTNVQHKLCFANWPEH